MNEFINSLLDSWRENGKFGLTLPFIFGALWYKGFSNGPESGSFSSMLDELQAASVTYRLAYCDKADDLILAPVNNSPVGCKRVSKNGVPTSLWIQHDLVNEDVAHATTVFKALWERYGLDIEAGRYSCTKGGYHAFTAEDLALIEKAFEKTA